MSASSAAAAARPSCLTCHPVHYSEISRCTGCHRGDDRTVRKNVTHRDIVPGKLVRYRIPGNPAQEEGTHWIERAGCRRCHIIQRSGNRLAANLDRLPGRHPLQIRESIMKPVTFMPDFRFDEEPASLLVNAILAAAEPGGEGIRSKPVIVRFSEKRHTESNIFDKKCGGCHRLLTEKHGALGSGEAGPNLSGLLSGHYPKTHGKGERWTAERLERWLVNPRRSRQWARMKPVPLDNQELRQLLSIFSSQESPSNTDTIHKMW